MCMLTKQVDILAPYRTLPISYLVRTANQFTCDIYIQGDATRSNVKDYEAMQTGLQPRGNSLVFYLEGSDEGEAELRLRRLFRV